MIKPLDLNNFVSQNQLSCLNKEKCVLLKKEIAKLLNCSQKSAQPWLCLNKYVFTQPLRRREFVTQGQHPLWI